MMMMNDVEVPTKYQVVAVWERRRPQSRGQQLNYWLPYSADVSQLIERSFQSNLTSVRLGDALDSCERDQQKVIHFAGLLEQRIDDTTYGSGVPVRRSIYSVDSCVGRGISWQWLDNQTNRWHFYNVDIQDHIEKAYQSGERGIDLSKSATHPLPYFIDFVNKMQKRKSTGTRRPIRRTEDRPYPPIRLSDNRPYPSAEGNDSSPPESSSALRRSKRIAKRTNSLPKNGENMTASSEFSAAEQFPQSAEETPGSLSSMVLNWFKTPLFRNASSPPDLTASSDSPTEGSGSGLGEEPSLLVQKKKKNRVASFMNRNSKRPTHKNPYIVPSESPSQQDDIPIDDLLIKYGTAVPSPPEENCCVCYDSLQSPSSYDAEDCVTLQLKRCSHMFHMACLRAMLSSQSPVTYLQCPTCKVIYGCKIGNQPPGKMTYFIVRKSLPGYEGVHTICIMYDFRDGIQDESHPTPRQSYSARTFPRACYLPDDEKGRKVLRLLMVAWQRRLIFTIGSSVTTGQHNVVTWNEIHHKTEFGSNLTGHGYPDPNYLDNVLLELATQGVFDDGE